MRIPYSTQDIDDVDIKAVTDALTSGWLTTGPFIAAFEQAFAKRHGVAHAVAVSSATAGLHIGCLALGIGPGKRVWTVPNSFVASANCALYTGGDVDFVDIDPVRRVLCVDALAAKLEATPSAEHPDVLIPVDFAGLPCDYDTIAVLAERYGFRVMADSSHGVGATYKSTPLGGRNAALSIFSFHPVKIITTAEGGMLTTDDADLAKHLRRLRSHGVVREEEELETLSPGGWWYEQQELGYNYRITDLQAALGLSQLQKLDEFYARRQHLFTRYGQLLADLPITQPTYPADRTCAHHLYVVEVDDRDRVFAALRDAGIGVNVHYIPIHLQPFYRKRGFSRGDFPNAERYYDRAISLPLFPRMTDEQQDYVVARLAEALTP